MALPRLGICSALALEQAGIRALLTDAKPYQRAGRQYVVGTWKGLDVVLALSGIGKVAAATTATAMIEHMGVQRIVFTGVAGGLAEGVQVGDVVIANAFLQHDMDATPLFPRYEVPLYGTSRFTADIELTTLLAGAARDVIKGTAQVHRGLIVSGDQFISSAEQSHALRQQLPDALAVEMEGAAVAQVCHDYHVPFAALRSISDRADATAHVDFMQFVREVASHFTTDVVRLALDRLADTTP